MHSVCWGGCDQSLEWIKARSSLRSKRSVITHSALDPLRVLHSRSRRNCSVCSALCSLHLNVIRDYWEKRNMYESCSTLLLFCGTPKIIPTSANNIVTPLVSFTVGFLAENTEQNLNYSAGLRLLIIIILVPTGSDRMHHISTCFWFLRTHSCALNVCAPTDRDQETAFNNYKGSLQMWYIDLIQKINKQVLHDFVLFHQRK